MRSELTGRSRSAGVIRGSVPDLRRVVDLQRHSDFSGGQGKGHGSLNTAGNAGISQEDGCPPDAEQLDAHDNGTATNYHQHHVVTSSAATAAAGKIDEIFNITDHVRMEFDDIFVQPTALNSGDIGRFLTVPVRRVFGFVFSYTQEAVYYFLSIVTGLAFGVAWGTVFGLLDFATIWLAQPLISVYCVLLRAVAMPFRATVRCLLDPVFEATAQTLRHVTVRLCVAKQQQVPELVAAQPATNGQTASPPVEWLGYV